MHECSDPVRSVRRARWWSALYFETSLQHPLKGNHFGADVLTLFALSSHLSVFLLTGLFDSDLLRLGRRVCVTQTTVGVLLFFFAVA